MWGGRVAGWFFSLRACRELVNRAGRGVIHHRMGTRLPNVKNKSRAQDAFVERIWGE